MFERLGSLQSVANNNVYFSIFPLEFLAPGGVLNWFPMSSGLKGFLGVEIVGRGRKKERRMGGWGVGFEWEFFFFFSLRMGVFWGRGGGLET